jgi:fructokinase
MTMDHEIFGGVEGGGTKYVCGVANRDGELFDTVRFPTTSPEETLDKVISFFKPHVQAGKLKKVGVGSFGPVDIDPASPTYGSITATPKPGWSHTPIVDILQQALGVKVFFDTDVNAAGLGEYRWGASQGCDPSLYLTIGTGIGGGCLKDGKPFKGMLAPEMGHIFIPHDLSLDPFPGACPFHGDCFEGLASGPAIQKRFGASGESLPEEHPFWQIEAGYIALALCNYIVTLSPKKIILGGGVMRREFLFSLIRSKVQSLLNGYVASPLVVKGIDEYVVPPGLGDRSGLLGAVALALIGE